MIYFIFFLFMMKEALWHKVLCVHHFSHLAGQGGGTTRSEVMCQHILTIATGIRCWEGTKTKSFIPTGLCF